MVLHPSVFGIGLKKSEFDAAYQATDVPMQTFQSVDLCDAVNDVACSQIDGCTPRGARRGETFFYPRVSGQDPTQRNEISVKSTGAQVCKFARRVPIYTRMNTGGSLVPT